MVRLLVQRTVLEFCHVRRQAKYSSISIAASTAAKQTVRTGFSCWIGNVSISILYPGVQGT